MLLVSAFEGGFNGDDQLNLITLLWGICQGYLSLKGVLYMNSWTHNRNKSFNYASCRVFVCIRISKE